MTSEQKQRFISDLTKLSKGIVPWEIEYVGFRVWTVYFRGDDAELAALRVADHYDRAKVRSYEHLNTAQPIWAVEHWGA
ncbi:MAG: hypothetical protein ACWGQW_04215 [bacterium]|jgi:hypothetical protein